MVAPNGARKTKEDHPNLPITISEIVREAVNCFNKGANAIHAHVRDKKGDHCLDVGLYRELLSELDMKVPELPVQITTEAVGKFSPEAMGDYLAGPNHVLPTSGSAKFSSGLSVNDFLKRHSLIKITKSGIERLGPSVISLAKHENLDGHANSVKIRIKKDI